MIGAFLSPLGVRTAWAGRPDPCQSFRVPEVMQVELPHVVPGVQQRPEPPVWELLERLCMLCHERGLL